MKFDEFVKKFSDDKLTKIKGIVDNDSVTLDANKLDLKVIEKLCKSNVNILNSDEFLKLDNSNYKFDTSKVIEKYKNYNIAGIIILKKKELSKKDLSDNIDLSGEIDYDPNTGMSDEEYFNSFDLYLSNAMSMSSEVIVKISISNIKNTTKEKARVYFKEPKVSSSINCFAVLDVKDLDTDAVSILEDGAELHFNKVTTLLGLFDSEKDANTYIKKRKNKDSIICQIVNGSVNKKTVRQYATNEYGMAFLTQL